MKALFSIIFLFIINVAYVNAQQETTAKEKKESQRRIKLVKGTKVAPPNQPIARPNTPIYPAINVTPEASENKKHRTVQKKQATPVSIDKVRKFANSEEKDGYYATHPEEYKQALKPEKEGVNYILKEDYDKFSDEKKAIIDANPNKYQVVLSMQLIQRKVTREHYNSLSPQKKKLVDDNPQKYMIID
jgi:hypothetical protein